MVDEFTQGVLARMTTPGGFNLDEVDSPFTSVHANYWLSGLSGHVIKHELNLPLVCTFHTLDRVKAESMPEEVEADMPHRRAEAEASIIDCSDAVLASCSVEAEQIASLYGADPDRIRIVPLGVDHAFFGPGHRPQARRALGLPLDGRLLLFVGRIQPLKCADAAVETLAELSTSPRRPYHLVIVGGPSGPHGEKSLQGLVDLADARGVSDRVHHIDPQPHELLSSYYRAADVCIVPSRSELFGLVALESAACGTPVVASAVGGLTTLVDHGRTGFLVEDPTPSRYAAAVRRVFDEPLAAERLSTASVLRARRYTWRAAAGALLDLHDGVRLGPSRPVPLNDRPRALCRSSICPRRRNGRRGQLYRRLGRARAVERRPLGGGGAPGRHRPHGIAALVPALQGRREGLHHPLADPAPTYLAP